MTTENTPVAPGAPKLLDQVRARIRVKLYSTRTEMQYCNGSSVTYYDEICFKCLPKEKRLATKDSLWIAWIGLWCEKSFGLCWCGLATQKRQPRRSRSRSSSLNATAC